MKESSGESDRNIVLHGVQKKKLHDNQEQADDPGQAAVQQVLPFLPEAHPSQGNQIRDVQRHWSGVGFFMADAKAKGPGAQGQRIEPKILEDPATPAWPVGVHRNHTAEDDGRFAPDTGTGNNRWSARI